ncbi:hypothetical protein PS2_044430 [Malus domestica]
MVEFLSQDYAEGISVQARLDSIATLDNLSLCHQIIPSPEVDAEGEKVDGVSTTALRLVEEKLAKISSGR